MEFGSKDSNHMQNCTAVLAQRCTSPSSVHIGKRTEQLS